MHRETNLSCRILYQNPMKYEIKTSIALMTDTHTLRLWHKWLVLQRQKCLWRLISTSLPLVLLLTPTNRKRGDRTCSAAPDMFLEPTQKAWALTRASLFYLAKILWWVVGYLAPGRLSVRSLYLSTSSYMLTPSLYLFSQAVSLLEGKGGIFFIPQFNISRNLGRESN